MFRTSLIPLIALALCAAGCAHQPGIFRLTTPGSAATLIPPGARDAAVTRAAVRVGPIPRKMPCSPSPHGLLIERKWLTAPRVIVTREALNSTSGAELFSWAIALEKQGCLAPNEAFRLAENVIDALPLDLGKRRELLQGRADLKSVDSLRVVSPIYKPGVPKDVGDITAVSQGGQYSLNVDIQDSHSMTGYEIDWYDLAPQDAGPGYRMVPQARRSTLMTRWTTPPHHQPRVLSLAQTPAGTSSA